MDALSPRRSRTRPSAKWLVVAAFAVAAAGCAQPPPVGGSGSSTTVPLGTDAVVSTTSVRPPPTTSSSTTSTTSAPSSTTSTTTTTLVDVSSQVPPKPDGEPDIDLLPLRPTFVTVELNTETGEINYEGDAPPYFSFEAVSGFDSYTVRLVRSFQGGDEVTTRSNEGRVEGGSRYFRSSGDGVDPIEIVFDDSDSLWIRENGVWNSASGFEEIYQFQSVILPDWQHVLLYESFETLTFSDWDLIDGVWYARYAASREFAAVMTGRWLLSNAAAIVAGDVWVSPLGYMYSYSVSVDRTDTGQLEETTWTLSNLGSTTIDGP